MQPDIQANLEFEWAIGLNRTALNILGVWPNPNERKSWKSSENLRVYITLIFMTNFLAIPQMWSLLIVRDDLMLVIDNFQNSCPVILALMKCMIFWWKKDAISPVIREIKNDWLKVKTADEKSTMIKRTRLARKITMAGYFLVLTAWCILGVLPCFGLSMRYVTNLTDPGKKPLPFQTHYFYDITKSFNFLMTFILQTISILFAGIYFTVVDCFCAHLGLHACGQLENLSQHLTKLCQSTKIQLQVSSCVNEHVRLIRFVHTFDNAVNLMLLGHLFTFTVLFCFQGFLFVKVIKDGGNLPILRFIWLAGAIIIVLLHMFVYCFVGEILVACADSEYEWAIGLNRMALNIVGIWPQGNERKSWKSSGNLRVYIALVLVVNIVLIPQLWSLLVVRHDLVLVIDNLQISFPVISGVMKCTIMWWKNDAISPVVNEIENDWLKDKTAEEKSTMIKRARLIRSITLAGYFMVISMWLILNALPCFGLTIRYVTNLTDPGKKPLPIQTHYFYDITKRSNYLMTFMCQAITILFAATYFTGVDCFCVHLILHVCGQMENLALHLTKLCNMKNIRPGVSFCVNEHVRLIRFVRIVDNSVNLLMLGQLFIFAVLFCFQGFLFVKVIREGGNLPILRVIWLVGAILTILLHMFVYCFVGEILVMCCEEMYEAAYNCSWYIWQPNEAKMLLLILLRAHSALYITAGKIFPMTLGTFCSVIKTSVSYISVLLAYT